MPSRGETRRRGNANTRIDAEAASGCFPREAVTMMDSIIRGVEGDIDFQTPANESHGESGASHADAICSALRLVARLVLATATIAYTRSGFTSMRAARERPVAPILSLTPMRATARRLTPV